MSKATEPLTKTELLAKIAVSTGLSNKQVAAVLDALVFEIGKALSSRALVALTILDLVKIEKKAAVCPNWPASIKVTVVPKLLPGPNQDCVCGLHTYHKSPASNDRGQPVCGLCGKDAIDWKRLHEQNIADVDYTVAQLKTDRFRSKWWFKDLDEKAMQHASRKGSNGFKDAVRKRVETSVGPAQPFRDGAQTPLYGNLVYYGQHGTATCCRKCIEVWHGIPQGRELTRKEIDYLAGLLVAYIFAKLTFTD